MECHKVFTETHITSTNTLKNSDTHLLAKAVYMPHREQRVISHMEMVYFTIDFFQLQRLQKEVQLHVSL